MQLTMTIATFNHFGNSGSDTSGTYSDPLFIVYVTRLMCAIALHMIIEPEIY